MNRLVPSISWLLQLTPNSALWLSVRHMLLDVLRLLIDPETNEVRSISPAYHHGFEGCLQIAEASITRLIWMHARQLRGLPSSDNPEAFRYRPPHHLSSAQTTLARATDLVERLMRIDELGARLAARFDQPTTPAHLSESAEQPRAIANEQNPVFTNSRADLHQTGPPEPRWCTPNSS